MRTVSGSGVREEPSAFPLDDAELLLSLTRTDGVALGSEAAALPVVDLDFEFAAALDTDDVEMLSLCVGIKSLDRRWWLNRLRGKECLCVTALR